MQKRLTEFGIKFIVPRVESAFRKREIKEMIEQLNFKRNI